MGRLPGTDSAPLGDVAITVRDKFPMGWNIKRMHALSLG
jgi:hypothetical protein